MGLMTPLNSRTVASLRPDVPVPSYDRDRITAGVVHLGVGGFHRAHQAAYLDRLMNLGMGSEWGVCGVGVMPSDAKMKRTMAKQDHLYTLVLKHPDGRWEPRVIGSIVDYQFAPDDPGAVITKLTDPTVRLVTLTVTEGGYNFHRVSGEFDADNPDVAADLVPGTAPRTIFGLVVEALSRRRSLGIPPFTILSCDNIPGNGEVAERTFTSFAHLRDPELGKWMRESVAFPNCMVDRITPVTTDDDRAGIGRRFDVDDDWPVVCEPFTQWVVEDKFPAGRPPLEEVGVQFVANVQPYEMMKLRLLNGSHQALAYFGYLAGIRFVDEVCRDPVFRRFLLNYMAFEAAPTLSPLPGIDLVEYQTTLIDRFANPEIRDTLARLCAQASDKIPKFVLPVIRDNLASGGDVRLAAAIVASWARYAEGIDEDGERIDVVDPLRETLRADAIRQRRDPLAFIANRDLFGDLVDDERFVSAYCLTLDSLHHKGARATVQELLSAPDR
jgi:mannitol 2-dehydrogenase